MADLSALWVLDDAGLTVPGAAELIAQAKDELATADRLGGDYLFHPEDPITQLVEVVGLQLASAYQLAENVSNSRDPDQAQGVLLRENGSIVGATIPAPTRSTIVGRFVGNPGVLVPSGSIVKYLATEDLWQSFQSYTIGASGTVDVELESVEFDAIEADAAGLSSWQIQTPKAGWTGFLSTEASEPGRAAPTNAEIREAIRLAAEGGGGAATYDSDLANVADVDGVSHVALFVNRTLVFDVDLDLDAKEARFVVEGGRKQEIFDAIAASESTGLNTIDTGTVTGSSTRRDNKVIEVSFSRPVDVPILFRVTLSGEDLPDTNEVEAIVFAQVVERGAEQDFGEKVIPAQYVGPVVAGFDENIVETITVEARLDSGDPWSTDPIILGQTERASISSDARPVQVISVAEDPLSGVAIGLELELTIDGGGLQSYVLTEAHTTVASLIEELTPEFTDVEFVDYDGRFLVKTTSTGAASEMIIAGNLLTPLGITADTYNGTDGDITVVIT